MLVIWADSPKIIHINFREVTPISREKKLIETLERKIKEMEMLIDQREKIIETLQEQIKYLELEKEFLEGDVNTKPRKPIWK